MERGRMIMEPSIYSDRTDWGRAYIPSCPIIEPIPSPDDWEPLDGCASTEFVGTNKLRCPEHWDKARGKTPVSKAADIGFGRSAHPTQCSQGPRCQTRDEWRPCPQPCPGQEAQN